MDYNLSQNLKLHIYWRVKNQSHVFIKLQIQKTLLQWIHKGNFIQNYKIKWVTTTSSSLHGLRKKKVLPYFTESIA